MVIHDKKAKIPTTVTIAYFPSVSTLFFLSLGSVVPPVGHLLPMDVVRILFYPTLVMS